MMSTPRLKPTNIMRYTCLFLLCLSTTLFSSVAMAQDGSENLFLTSSSTTTSGLVISGPIWTTAVSEDAQRKKSAALFVRQNQTALQQALFIASPSITSDLALVLDLNHPHQKKRLAKILQDHRQTLLPLLQNPTSAHVTRFAQILNDAIHKKH